MVKEKPNSIRVYDQDGFRRRAACVCVRSDAETEVRSFKMLLRNDKTKKTTVIKLAFA